MLFFLIRGDEQKFTIQTLWPKVYKYQKEKKCLEYIILQEIKKSHVTVTSGIGALVDQRLKNV